MATSNMLRKLFAEAQATYEILSDLGKRTWYDSHREVVLHGNDSYGAIHGFLSKYKGTTAAEDIYCWIVFFPQKSNIEYSDAPHGFYTTMPHAFEKRARGEIDACKEQEMVTLKSPGFGDLRSDTKITWYEDYVTYSTPAWLGFRHYRVLTGWMCMQFVQFVRKRDAQYKILACRKRKGHSAMLRASKEQSAKARAAKVTKLNADKMQYAGLSPESHNDEFSKEERDEVTSHKYMVCKKSFKTEAMFTVHEPTNKHKRAVTRGQITAGKEGKGLVERKEQNLIENMEKTNLYEDLMPTHKRYYQQLPFLVDLSNWHFLRAWLFRNGLLIFSGSRVCQGWAQVKKSVVSHLFMQSALYLMRRSVFGAAGSDSKESNHDDGGGDDKTSPLSRERAGTFESDLVASASYRRNEPDSSNLADSGYTSAATNSTRLSAIPNRLEMLRSTADTSISSTCTEAIRKSDNLSALLLGGGGQRKRTRDDSYEDSGFAPEAQEDSAHFWGNRNMPATPLGAKKFCLGVRIPSPIAPKSLYTGWSYGMEVSRERAVLREFAEAEAAEDVCVFANNNHSQDTFTSYKLDDFTVYYPDQSRLSGEMTTLNNLSVKFGSNVLLFDGVLSNGKVKRYVEGVPFTLLSIGNYGELSCHDVHRAIWIQTSQGKTFNDTWYELDKPSKFYERYYKPFLWLANLAKHFVDFLENHQAVELAHFKDEFAKWIKQQHWCAPSFRGWYNEYGRHDFRQPVVVHIQFLWNQAYNNLESKLTKHPIWKEALQMEAISHAPGKLIEETVVTPLVYECFAHIFGDNLKRLEAFNQNASAENDSNSSVKKRFFLDCVEILKSHRIPRDEFGNILNKPEIVEVEQGDVVAVLKDEETSWKKGKSEVWYAYVQAVNCRPNKKTTLDVIWLYLPEDTILGEMVYPYHNELFFSDNCNCSDDDLTLEEVLYKVPTAFFKGPGESGCEFFVRQKFSDAEANFTTLKNEDLVCDCRKPDISAYDEARKLYLVGDTVLVESYAEDYKKELLEPAQIMRFEDELQMVELRHLKRRKRDLKHQFARPNELVYTDNMILVQPSFLYRKCHIRFLPENTTPPSPYDRDGTGDCFFISTRITSTGDILPMPIAPPDFHEGYLPDVLPLGKRPLNGMDLFCGGGNFGRGIEEGGAVRNRWAVDLDIPALHTYRANLRKHEDTQLYLGSVNNYLRDALRGKFSSFIPPPGEVDFISAGSPCQGFSNANKDQNSEKSLRNSSLVASVASFVDYYRPSYALLENVHGLATDRKHPVTKVTYNVFSQLLCSLVAIGYQCQQFTLDAWSFGSCQTRTRLFVSIAAPGCQLPPRPPRSHEHPPSIRSKALFEAPNGKKFGGRELHGPCIFSPKTVKEGLGDLPFLGDNHPGICIRYPDHRNSRIESMRTRLLMTHIPKMRNCQSLRRALNAGRIPPCLDFYTRTEARQKDGSRSWSRIMEDELIRTITTTITPQCSFTGQWMHWDQNRLVTVMEVRRAQGFPDEEVLIGNAAQTFKIVGNSVDRAVALAWGLSIREAHYFGGKGDGHGHGHGHWNGNESVEKHGKYDEGAEKIEIGIGHETVAPENVNVKSEEDLVECVAESKSREVVVLD